MSAQHTPGPIEIDHVNSSGAVVIFASEDDPDDAGGLAIHVRGRHREQNAAELVKRWNCHRDLLSALTAMLALTDLPLSSPTRLLAGAAIDKATGKDQP